MADFVIFYERVNQANIELFKEYSSAILATKEGIHSRFVAYGSK